MTSELLPATRALTGNDFYFLDNTVEDIARYTSWGYHPIIIGDVLSPGGCSENGPRRYRVVYKLGHGAYGTVWLAENLDHGNTLVAVKVTVAEEPEDGRENEADMLMAASAVRPPDGSHIVTLLDRFMLKGPNGTHSVLVTEVVIPFTQTPPAKEHTPQWRRLVAHGLVKAVAQMHSANIVHGDLHTGNVGIAFPQLAQQTPESVMQHFPPPNVIVVLPINAANQTPSLPRYLVEPQSLAKFYQMVAQTETPVTKIFDLGGARQWGVLPQNFQCASGACSPELAFAVAVEDVENPPIEAPADIWAVGAAIYEIFCRSMLFYGVGIEGLPGRMLRMTASVPHGWKDWYTTLPNPPPVSQDAADMWWESTMKDLRPNCAGDADSEALVALLKRILVLDPSARPSATEILQDPWFTMAS